MSYRNLTIGAAATTALIGTSTKARVRLKDGRVQVRFTERTSLVNLPKDEIVKDLYVKSNSRRIGLPTAFGAVLEPGKIALEPGKYGWFSVVPAADAATAAGSVSN